MAAETELLELRLRVPLPSAELARVAVGALGPDLPRPRPGGPRPHPELRCCGEELEARWAGPGARGLRGGVSAFLDLLGLVLETMERFGGEGRGGGHGPAPQGPAHDPQDPAPEP